MTSNQERRSVILVVEDVEETRYGIERLLTASGYQVSTARDEEEAILKASLHHPDLILISLGLDPVRGTSNRQANTRARWTGRGSSGRGLLRRQAWMRVLKWQSGTTFT